MGVVVVWLARLLPPRRHRESPLPLMLLVKVEMEKVVVIIVVLREAWGLDGG